MQQHKGSRIGNKPPLSAAKLLIWLSLQLGSITYAINFLSNNWGVKIQKFFGVDMTPTDFNSRFWDLAVNLGIVVSLLSPIAIGVYGWLTIVKREPTYNALTDR